MGCSGAKEKLEDQMMLMKLQRMEIQMEKEKELKKLSEMEGKPIQRGVIPDYIDPVFAKEKNLYDDEFVLNDKKTDDNGKKKDAKSEVTKKKVKRDKGKDKMSENTAKKKKKVKCILCVQLFVTNNKIIMKYMDIFFY